MDIIPNIKDKTTVEAIAQEYCSNGRNKLEALKTIGYRKSYYNTRGLGVVYGNVSIIKAIADIDAKTRKSSIKTRLERQKFWTDVIADEKVTMGDRLRASELLGKSEADFTDNIRQHGDGLTIQVQERPKEESKPDIKLVS